MGYYTYFDLQTDAKYAKEEEIAIWMIDNLDYFSHKNKDYVLLSDYPLDALIGGDSMKWYDHSEDMKKVAKAFPDVTFILRGDGEESGDIWKEYYRGDRFHSSEAEIVFHPPIWL